VLLKSTFDGGKCTNTEITHSRSPDNIIRLNCGHSEVKTQTLNKFTSVSECGVCRAVAANITSEVETVPIPLKTGDVQTYDWIAID
jgi:hypothetical protein